MKMILMGTGTSHGIPVIGCKCKVCKSLSKKNKRLRCSAYIKDDADIVIDTGPEFRIQALRYNIHKLDAVLLTHSHADHLHGLDDLRIFSHTNSVDPSKINNNETEGKGLSIYANTNTLNDIRNRFDYIFTPVKEGGGKPKLNFIDSSEFNEENPLKINNLQILSVPLLHGHLNNNGYLISKISKKDGKKHSIAYLTDCNFIPESSYLLIKKNAGVLDHLVIDALREKEHSTHFNFNQAMEAADRLKPVNTWFIHMTHDFSHRMIKKYIKQNIKNYKALEEIVKNGGSVEPGYDGLVIEI